MTCASLCQYLAQLPLLQQWAQKIHPGQPLLLTGLPRFGKVLLVNALAQNQAQPVLVITANLEEAAQWTALTEQTGWPQVTCYPTAEASPYEPFDPEPETLWAQWQVLNDLQNPDPPNVVITTDRALQPHLPPPEVFAALCITINVQNRPTLTDLTQKLAALGYERVAQVNAEAQFSQRGDILDVYPVAQELPVRLEWFGDTLESLREFDPLTQRSLDALAAVRLTPVDYRALVLPQLPHLEPNLSGYRRFLGQAFPQVASLLSYLPSNTLFVIDEPQQCQLHHQRWWEQAQEQWERSAQSEGIPPLHTPWDAIQNQFINHTQIHCSEWNAGGGLNLSPRPIPSTPHQFAPLAALIRQQRSQCRTWILSAQPSRCVAVLQEHDCPAQFVPNAQDLNAIQRLGQDHTPIALKYTGLGELSGLWLPALGLLVLTDRELFGQHHLGTPTTNRRRRQARSLQVDPNRLQPGDYVIHRHHGCGQFLRLDKLEIDGQIREYLVLQYADGLLQVAVDQVGILSRYRGGGTQKPELHRLANKTWEKTREKVRKSLKKLAVNLLELYAKRAEQTRLPYPPDSPWQKELEDSFPYVLTPDQIKAIQAIKLDLEAPRPMDRLVCGDVGFGKTEVAIRAIFKVLIAGRQVALLAPTTVLAQQHYHTLKERFAPYPMHIALLNRFRSPQERKQILEKLQTGELDCVVGTHQLLSNTLKFRDLGLLVVDEEQRFGVNHKEKIKALKTSVDVLTLTATPIPRTLSMALSGLREMSLITTPPPSRRPIKTHLISCQPETIRTAIAQELDRGGQVFYVLPKIAGMEAAIGQIQQMIPSAKIMRVHGQLAPEELEVAMLAFSNGEADILVCTTIVESGLDIPRVNTIIIEDAHRFGLAQLYQLRGRVGRAGIQAHAWLTYPGDELLSGEAKARLRAIQEFTHLGSGYQLALRDLDIRGAGDLLGAEQSGQVAAVGFDLYLEMLQEAIQEVRGQEIPSVDDTQIDLNLTAFIPTNYMPDLEQKLQAYRTLATAENPQELTKIEQEWANVYGVLPAPVTQLILVMRVKLLAKSLGISRIRPDKPNVILETMMAQPAWQQLLEGLSAKLHSRFVYAPGKITVRGLATLQAGQQLEQLHHWLQSMYRQRMA
ncbi:transcription-repair coupling factor [Gloeomargarita lithophora Alchichica-D10]|uniref:Transcription-repair-coupling factor n=1 Tax=Gloeomargarita lithophora Alchichica-D10 TaxID=1188229 RepID=A0A1J0AB71_9CYAN|nr:transcription-repair coupling factor [Gloeomargarita lithophora]APB33179.1 transcription-repair coupling factor [Gloeomargarita lithophora Alchichica-D10]